MKIIFKFIQKLLRLKSKLPYNGDWIFVSDDVPKESNENNDTVNDLGLVYENVDTVLSDLSRGKSDLDFVYERTKEFENTVSNGVGLVRDKAKSLLNTSSFISAIIFGSSTILLSTINELNFWNNVEIILYILLIQHFVRSLFEAMYVLTREEAVYMPPKEFIDLSNLSKKEQMKSYISRSIVYANLTDRYAWKRSDRLIKGQHAFRYGLIFSAIFLVVHLSKNIYSKEDFNDDMRHKISLVETKIDGNKEENRRYIESKLDSAFKQIRLTLQDSNSNSRPSKKVTKRE